MSLHHLAERLAKKGRNGDSLLLHVQPHELSTLESMLGKTTVNPATGLPEAGVWSKILKGIAIAGAAMLGPAALIPTIGMVVASNKMGAKKSDASEAGKYLDSRTEQRVQDQYKFAPPTTMPNTFLRSISDQVYDANNPRTNLLGVQMDWSQVPRPMGQGFAEGGQMTEAKAKETVLAMLAKMQQQQPQAMAHGRRVQGPGTGLDDSIPARLSVGEYVIPADVVSMMGDGSTEAGGKKLDELLTRVRMQKTGTKKQAKPLRMGGL